jgi:predicted adenine nucleotide alpha hydrolase (AANH) superfamily ATPase
MEETKGGEAVSFCSFCKSETDHVLQRSMWSCGTHFNDPHWRTKECYKRELNEANKRIKELEAKVDELELHDLEKWLEVKL